MTGPSCSRRRVRRSTRACSSDRLLLAERLGGRLGLGLETQRLGDRACLELGLPGLVAQPLGGDLGRGHRLAGRAQRSLDLGLLGRARAQPRGHLLARLAVGGELGLQRPRALLDRLERRRDDLAQPPRERQELRVGLQPRPQACKLRRSPLALALALLRLTALGAELALELGAAHRERSLRRGLASLLDHPLAAAHRLLALGPRALCLAHRILGPCARGFGLAHVGQRLLAGARRLLLGLRRALDVGQQPLALVAPREHQLGAALADLPDLSRAAEPHAPGARGGDPGEVARQVLEALDDPCVGQQPRRQGEHAGRPAEQLEQRARPRNRRRGRRAGARRALGGRREQRAPALGPGAVEHRLGAADVVDQRGVERAAEGSRERQLISVLDAQLGAQRARARPGGRRGTRMAAQELVGRGELGPDACRIAPRPLRGALGLGQRLAGGRCAGVGLDPRRLGALELLVAERQLGAR